MNCRFLIGLILALVSSSLPSHAEVLSDEGHLRLYNTHTRQHLDVIYRRGTSYLPEALSKLDVFLRDHLTGEVHHFDPHLFDVLFDLTRPAAVPMPRSRLSVATGVHKPTSTCEPIHRASPRRACICRRRPSTFACRV